MARELIVATNPARRKKRRTSAKQRAAARRNIKKAQAAQRRRSPARRRTTARKRRRNPLLPLRRRNPARSRIIPRGFMQSQLMPALVGGGGAVANDLAYNFVMSMVPAGTPMIDQLRTGYLRHVGKAGSALLLTWLSSMVVDRKTANQLGAGALTVVGYNVVRDVLSQAAPNLNLGMYIEPGMGMYVSPGNMGAYPGAGWNPATGSGFRKTTSLRAVPGGVNVPPQLHQGNPYGSKRRTGYSDMELEAEYA